MNDKGTGRKMAGGGHSESAFSLEDTRPVTCPQVSDEHTELARIFRALGHPARLAIVEALARQPDACCGDIVDTLPLAQSTVSQHLQVLKETGLLTCCSRGRCCHYDLNRAMLDRARAASSSFFMKLSSKTAEDGPGCCKTDEQNDGACCDDSGEALQGDPI
jgi:ArsR family transcriptional regulator, arsenate/arsenite/antimonite-responsive transcriptional repressor